MKIGLHAAMLERRYPHPPGAVAQAAALGADSYEIDIGIGRPGEPWAARFGTFKQLVPALQETAERIGVSLASLCLGTLWQTSLASPDPDVSLALENVCQSFMETAAELLEVVTALDSPVCGIYYDLGNASFVGQDPAAELRVVTPHLVRVHAKDTVNVRRERLPLPETPITGDFGVWQRPGKYSGRSSGEQGTTLKTHLDNCRTHVHTGRNNKV